MVKKEKKLSISAYIAVYVGITQVCLMVQPSTCSVYMREEECRDDGNGGRKCANKEDKSVESNNRQISILEVEEPKYFQQSIGHYTPLPFAAFMQPRPVFQGSEERVFNVLERERTATRLLKGGKRHKSIDVSNGNSEAGEEQVSRSHVNFRRRKGGKRSDKKKQLRKERIERKRARRKERRRLKKERKKLRGHPKLKKNRRNKKRKKVKKNKLKSLQSRGSRRDRKEQIGASATMFVSGNNLTIGDKSQSGPKLLEANKLPNEETILSGETAEIPSAPEIGELHHPFDVHNYHQTSIDMDDYFDEDDSTDEEYDSNQIDDYQISPDYFLNWNDNASAMDYFTQGEDTTASPGKSQI